MKAYMCSVCSFLYDNETAEKDIEGNLISFENLPDDWECPICGIAPDLFIVVESDRTQDISKNKK